MCLSVCLCVIKLFANYYCSCSILYDSQFSRHLAYMTYVPLRKKNLWNRSFKMLILKFWGNFLNFKFGPSLWNSSSRTIYSRPTSVYFDVSIIWYSHVYLLCHIVVSGVFYYTVCRSEGLHIEWIVQKLKKKNPFTDLPKETQNILEYVFVCKTDCCTISNIKKLKQDNYGTTYLLN